MKFVNTVLFAISISLSAKIIAGVPQWNTGKIIKIYADSSDIVLKIGTQNSGPCGSNLYHIRRSNENFNEFYDLMVTAFVLGSSVSIQTVECSGRRNITSHGSINNIPEEKFIGNKISINMIDKPITIFFNTLIEQSGYFISPEKSIHDLKVTIAANNERWDKILYNVLKDNNLTLYVQKHKFSIGINTRNRHLYTFKEAIKKRKLDNLKTKKQLALNKIRKSLRTQSINDFLKERENIKSARQQKQENIRLAKVEGKHNCSYIRDKLLQHEENRKWYNLDSNGQRRYLSEEEVKRNHMKYIDLENKLCK